MELAASSRSGGRERGRPEASEFDVPGKYESPDGGGADMDVAGSTCGDSVTSLEFQNLQTAERGKMTKPLFPIDDADILNVALFRDIQCASVLKQYKEEFQNTMGAAQSSLCSSAEVCIHSQHASSAISGSRWQASSVTSGYDFVRCKEKQDVLFDYKKQHGPDGDAFASAVPASGSRPDGDDLVRPAHIEPAAVLPIRQRAKQLIEELSHNKVRSIVLNDDQLFFWQLL
jgi:hypothetical protein